VADQRQGHLAAQPDRDRARASRRIERGRTGRQRRGIPHCRPAGRRAGVGAEPDALRTSQRRQIGHRVGSMSGQYGEGIEHRHAADRQHQGDEAEQPDRRRPAFRRSAAHPVPSVAGRSPAA
jgi:hypothetical protein